MDPKSPNSAIAVERSIWIDASPERVWPALTDPTKLTQWYATQFQWEIPTLAVGAAVTFHNGVDQPLTAVIEVLDPPREFRLRWAAYGEVPALVTAFTLTPENGGTRATITESGYEAVPAAERQQWLDATGAGYAMSVENLKAHVEGRRPAALTTATVYDALADRTRRDLLVDLAAHSPKTATQLAAQYTHITRQGLLRHLTVLKAAGLVTVQQHGREKRFELSPAPLTELEAFVQALHATLDQRLLRLKALVEEEEKRSAGL